MIALFWARPQSFSADGMRALAETLEPFETARALGFHHAADRTAYLTAHALLRIAVLAQSGRHPLAWNLAYTHAGRPLAVDAAEPLGEISIAHTRAYAVAAFSQTDPIGIDVEDTRRTQPGDALLRASLADADRAALLAQPPALHAALFAALWTRREAVFKAGGSTAFTRTFSVAPDAVVSIAGGTAETAIDVRQFDEMAVRRALQSTRAIR